MSAPAQGIRPSDAADLNAVKPGVRHTVRLSDGSLYSAVGRVEFDGSTRQQRRALERLSR